MRGDETELTRKLMDVATACMWLDARTGKKELHSQAAPVMINFHYALTDPEEIQITRSVTGSEGSRKVAHPSSTV